jgi:putative addiction module CopG family antidote
MNVSLSRDMKAFVEKAVKSGRYATSSDVVLAGLTKLMQSHSLEACSTAELEAIYPGLRIQIAEGLADLRAGKFVDGDEFFDAWEREEQKPSKRGRKTA